MNLTKSTIGSFLDYHAEHYPDLDAAVFYQPDRRFTWRELREEVDRVAKGLLARHISRGRHVAMWGTNVPEWLLVQLACARIGAVLITINPEWKQQELEYALRQSDTNLLIMTAGFSKKSGKKLFRYDYLDLISGLCPEPGDKQCRLNFPELEGIVLTEGHAPRGYIAWETFLQEGEQIADASLQKAIGQVQPDDIAMIQYTSGTTGFPKGAMLSQYNVVNDARAAAEHMRLRLSDRVCGPVPYYHCFGSILFNLGCLVTGATMVVPADHFDSLRTLEAVERERCTALYGVPTMFIAEIDEPERAKFDLSSLRTGIMAGAPVDRELFEAVTQQLGAREMTIAYGLTEASPVTHQTEIHDPLDKRFATVGRPIDHTRARIVDPVSLRELGAGEVGEIWVKGFHVMAGYYQKPEETASSIVDGWLRTGDLGTVDADGYYRIVGRLKEMIIVGGHNVYPAEVEQALHSLLDDKVEIAQVVGVPHPKLQEVVGLVVKCHPGQTLDLEEVRARCEGKLEWPKIPRQLRVVDDFSRYSTVTGKIQKFKLSALLQQGLQPA